MPAAVKHLHFSEPISSFSKLFSSIKPARYPLRGLGQLQAHHRVPNTWIKHKNASTTFSLLSLSLTVACVVLHSFSIFHLQHSDLSSAGPQFLMTTSCSSMASSSSVRLANIFPMSLRTSLVPSGETLPKAKEDQLQLSYAWCMILNTK